MSLPTDDAASAPDTTTAYGALPEHVADVWRPRGARLPAVRLVLVVHGGFWRAGYDRAHVRPLCADLAGRGFAVAAVEYRRTGMAGGGWPGTFEDVRAALERVPALVQAELGGTVLGGTVLLGHSAGGQLVLWAGSQVAVPRLAGVVSLGGVCDLVQAHRLALGRQGDRGAVDTLLGGSPQEVPERYAATDPMQLPVPTAPVTLVHGDLDRSVPVELSRRYAARHTAPGVTLVELAGVEHFAPIDPRTAAWGAVLAALGPATAG